MAVHRVVAVAVLLRAAAAIKVVQDEMPMSRLSTTPPAETPSPTAAPTAAPTPAPTHSEELPGIPCPCLPGTCFQSYDLNNDSLICQDECDLQSVLLDNCTGAATYGPPLWDTDGDGCVNISEWADVYAATNGSVCPLPSIELPDECAQGYYLAFNPTECVSCWNGFTRRRRSLECSPCPAGYADVGDFDDCADTNVKTITHQLPNGSVDIPVSEPSTECDAVATGDSITIRGQDADCVSDDCMLIHDCVVVTIATSLATGGTTYICDVPLPFTMPQYAEVVLTCTTTDGSDLSRKHSAVTGGCVCACGDTLCDTTEVCTEYPNGTGVCNRAGPYPEFPTPAPTVGAKGDPHLVNLQGEHFDINHGGTFMLLRFPQDTSKPADVEINALVEPEWGKPCITYITQVELSGKWLNGQRVQVRCFLREHSEIDQDTEETVKHRAATFLGMRTLDEGDVEAPWVNITDAPVGGALSHPDSDVEVKLIKSQWFPKSKHQGNNPGVAGQFQFNLRDKRNTEAAKIVIRQDLPGQEHLNMAIRRLSVLGRADVGGLLGFDGHSEELEHVTKDCAQWRLENHYDVQAIPERDVDTTSWPRWKWKWQKIREERKLKAAQEAAGMPRGDGMPDNEAGASLQSKDIDERDVFEDAYEDRDSLEDQYAEAGLACMCPADLTVYSEGVLTERMSALFAEATWD
mmetsp:Transcript_126012/g.342123  ORF Transcript_126012/g.342123 Transcript_126012/m.342123 type:complete len:690 (+) Transcript_126012:124-2193(+)